MAAAGSSAAGYVHSFSAPGGRFRRPRRGGRRTSLSGLELIASTDSDIMRAAMMDDELSRAAAAVISACHAAAVRIIVVEASTGGAISNLLTSVPGASAVFDRALVGYSNESKVELLRVPLPLLLAHGSVSEEAACSMAHEGLAISAGHAQLCLAVTGVEGPGSTSPTKPAGLVHLAAVQDGKSAVLHEERRFGDLGRAAVRRASVAAAFSLILRRLQEP